MSDNSRHDRSAGSTVDVTTEAGADETPVQAIVRGMATMSGVDALALDPLYDHVEVDALETLLEHAEGRDCDVCVEFTAGNAWVSVDSSGAVRITDDSPEPPTVGRDK